MEIKQFEFNFFSENTYVIWDNASKKAAIVDPGMMNDEECARLDAFIAAKSLMPQFILLTHMHVDHTLGIEHLQEKYSLQVFAHKGDAPLGQARQQQAQMFHLPMRPRPLGIDRCVTDGETLLLGRKEIKVIATPGHSPGGVCYYVPESGFVLTGDTLFQGSIGRTDLPGGNHRQLISSIKAQLMNLPPETRVYPGHGPFTTIGREEVSNAFL